MELLRSVAEIRAFRARHAGRRLGLVPTMGALHEGHLSLMRDCAQRAEVTVASIFVNPTQFGPNEDLDAYPRDEEGDLAKAESAGCDAVFLPSVEVMYPAGAATTVSVAALTAPLCGASRPGHFDGVTTVVLKLLNLSGCDLAVFGEKDYQQLAVIRRMVRDLDVPVEVIGHPIVRESDGLALSSRNVYLDTDERRRALGLSRGLARAAEGWEAGERDPRILEAAMVEGLEARVDYAEARDAEDLSALDGPARGPVVLAIAAFVGRTRLIDNRLLS